MTNGFDILSRARVLQVHWLKRLCAFAIDAAIVLLPTLAILYLLGVHAAVVFGIISGIIFMIYSALAEATSEQTIGKAVLHLRVKSRKGKVTAGEATLRNIPKFFWYIFPIIDVLLGLTTQGDPRQRLSDRILGTTVVQAHYLRVKVHRIDVDKEATKPPAKA